MIIKGGPIKTESGHADTADHIFEGPKNEKITTLQGNALLMQDMVFDAQNSGLKYCFHHFKISPDKLISREQAYEDFEVIAKEYGFNLDDAVIVEHKKPRATSENSDVHWHLIAPHFNHATGKALDCRNSYKRNEKLSRLSEIRTGQTIIQGRHNKAVFFALQKEGKTAEAQAIRHLAEGELPSASFSVNQQKKAEKKGINLPKEKQAIKTLWQASDSLKAFQAGLSEQGYTLKPGDKANTYIIEKNGVLLGSANRLIGMKKELFVKQYKELENEQSNFRNQTGHIEHNRNASRDRRPISVGANSGTPGNDTDTAKPDNHNTIASLENSQQNRKRYAKHEEIKANQILKNIKIYDDSYVKIIDDNYINNLKEMLKKQRKEDYRKIRNAYRNIEYQKYYYKSSNRTYDTNILNIMYNCFSRLFKFSNINNKKTDIIKPNVKPPLPFDTWKKLTHDQKNTLRFSCMYHYQRTFENMIEFEKLHGITSNNTFQNFLHALKNKGDFMAEEIINLYPYQYIKELDNQFLKSELYKIMRNENFCRYTKDDIKENIVLVCENLLIDKDIKEKNAETFRIKESINRMKSMLTSNTTKENKTYNYK